MLNQVVLVGRLTDKPTIIEAENGKKYTTIVLAVQRSFKNSEGIYETDFFRCVLWNGIAAEVWHLLVFIICIQAFYNKVFLMSSFIYFIVVYYRVLWYNYCIR